MKDFIPSIFDGLFSAAGLLGAVATLVGVAAGMTGPERARRRAAQAKRALDSAPRELLPAFERMHWEASVHLVAVTLSAASYGRYPGAWASVGVLSLAGVGVFSALLTTETKWDPEVGALSLDGTYAVLAILFGVTCFLTLPVAGSIEGSRQRFYSIMFDKLFARVHPGAELLEEARKRDSRKWFVLLAVGWTFSLILLIGATGVNTGMTAQGTQPAGIGGGVLTGCLVAGTLGVGIFSWVLLLRWNWNRRPLDTLFSPPEKAQLVEPRIVA